MKTMTAIGVAFLMLSSAFGEEKCADWIKVSVAAWRPRDSQGELVYRDRMWILGGYTGSYVPALRDVWSSLDGKEWRLVTNLAGWKSSDIPMTLVFQDKMWFMGGWYNARLPGHAATNEVWCSTDGANWEQVENASWSPRVGSGAVAFKDKMWIPGGTEDYLFAKDENSLRNDVWCSSDGRKWSLVTHSASSSPRALHQAVVLDGKIWILGGGNFQPIWRVQNDVWCSEDGNGWTKLLEHAPWQPRIWFSALVYRNRIWVPRWIDPWKQVDYGRLVLEERKGLVRVEIQRNVESAS